MLPLLLCLFLQFEVVVGGCGGGGSGTSCPLKVTDYTRRPTSTYICEADTKPSGANNYCLRDDIAAYTKDQHLNIIANGCPGHPYFVHDELRQKYSFSGADLSSSCDSTGCGFGSCSTCGSGGCSSCDSGGCSSCGSGSCSSWGSGDCSSCGSGGCSSCGSGSCSTCGSGGCGICGSGGWSGNCSSGCGSAGCCGSRRLCCSSCSSSVSCASTTPSANPYIPRYQEYQFSLPSYPRVSSNGSSTLLQAFPLKADDYPIGIAINGILIISEHYNKTDGVLASIPMVKDFDNCGGHGDRSNRYHYHGPPICLLLAMGATTPAAGAQFLFENTTQSQVAHWPLYGKPSPLVGFALDGFPIFGPYNISGDLQVAGSSDLDACLFSAKHQRYHLTANYPFSPPCLVGILGDFSSKQVNEGICPVVDSAFCSGPQCQPVSLDCLYSPFKFSISYIDCLSLGMTFALVLWLVYIEVSQYLHPNEFHYPFDKIILSVLPSFLLLTSQPLLYKAFYGLNVSDFDNFDLDVQAIETNLNEAINSFLAMTGVLYSLIIAQFFVMTNDKFKKIKDTLSEELSGCRQVVLCLQAMHVETEKEVKLKEDCIDVVIWYLGTLIKQWGLVNLSAQEEMQPLDLLYGSLTNVDMLCKEGSSSKFNMQVADRVMDSMNSVSVAKYQRCSLEEQELPILLWILLYLIASAMFLGVLLIQSGSNELNLGMCYVTTIMIGMSSVVIADMDLPYHGYIKVNIDSVVELFDYLCDVAQSSSKNKINVIKQSAVFFSSKDARRSSMANVEASIASKFRNGRRNKVSVAVDTKEPELATNKLYAKSNIDEVEEGKFNCENNKSNTEVSKASIVPPYSLKSKNKVRNID